MKEIMNDSWQTNGTPHSVIVLEGEEGEGFIYRVTYSNGYYGDVEEEECESIKEAEEIFNYFSKEFRQGNGFQF